MDFELQMFEVWQAQEAGRVMGLPRVRLSGLDYSALVLAKMAFRGGFGLLRLDQIERLQTNALEALYAAMELAKSLPREERRKPRALEPFIRAALAARGETTLLALLDQVDSTIDLDAVDVEDA